MARISVLIVFMLLASIATTAQEPRDHKKKWHVDQKEGKFYINKNLGVYLHISTSPDEDAETHRLKSRSGEAYTNPMFFDTEGYNTIRSPWAVDPKTKKPVVPQQDIIFEVYADGIAPKTEVRFKNAPRYRKNDTLYYGKNLSIRLNANDAVSGTEQIFYSLNGEDYKEYQEDITFDEDESGKYILRYYAVDYVGNAEDPGKRVFFVDQNAPEAEPDIDGKVLSGNKISGNAKLLILSRDDFSGVKQVKYKLNIDGPVKDYKGPIPVSSIAGGTHKMIVYAADYVDNSSAADMESGGKNIVDENGDQITFEVDKTAPEVNLVIQGDEFEGKYTYISPRSKVKLDASDKQAEVKNIFYGINQEANNSYSSPFKLNTEKGLQNIYYEAIDELDNRSETAQKSVYLDDVSPVSAIDYKRPQFFNRDTLFINKETHIEVFSKDYESGIKQIEYAIDEGNFKTFTENFTVSEKGYHTIRFRAIDNVNNTEETKKSNFFVDNTPPVIYANFSIEAIGKDTRNGEAYKVYPTYVKLYLGATDSNAGAESIYYSINGGELKEYASQGNINVSEARLLEEQGYYEVRILARDKLDNEGEKTIRFFVRDK